MKYKNFGKKSLEEIKGILTSLGLHLGMKVPLPEDEDVKRLLEG